MSERKEPLRNHAGDYANAMLRSQTALVDGQLLADYELLVRGHAIYLPRFFRSEDCSNYLKLLVDDMKAVGEGMVNWSQHLKHENPDFSPTFRSIVAAMADYFDVEVYATRLNFYPDATSWKPFHHDSHAYAAGHAQREDFTMGASFGGTRELIFKHVGSGVCFTFPQADGDVFAFDSIVNKQFQHGVPRGKKNCGPRFSIIAWGRRRTINRFNAGADAESKRSTEKPKQQAKPQLAKPQGAQPSAQPKEIARNPSNATEVVKIDDVAQMVDAFVLTQKKQTPKPKGRSKSRVQGSWAN
jgi:hypothetical protein